jgi:hypothetical protein
LRPCRGVGSQPARIIFARRSARQGGNAYECTNARDSKVGGVRRPLEVTPGGSWCTEMQPPVRRPGIHGKAVSGEPLPKQQTSP